MAMVECSGCRHPISVAYEEAMNCPSCGNVACENCFNADRRDCQVCAPENDPDGGLAGLGNELTRLRQFRDAIMGYERAWHDLAAAAAGKIDREAYALKANAARDALKTRNGALAAERAAARRLG